MRIVAYLFFTLLLSGCCCVCWWSSPKNTGLIKTQELCQKEVSKRLHLSSGAKFGFTTPQILENRDKNKKYAFDSYVDSLTPQGLSSRTYYRCFVNYNDKTKQAGIYDLKLYKESK